MRERQRENELPQNPHRRPGRGAIQLTFFLAQYQAQNLAQVIFGVLRDVLTCSALILNLAQLCAQSS